ncbi:MAG: ATP-binding protein [Bacteroidota bacterium]|nr:ATP-binding protein [Bacteroidota bacterium]
MALRTLVDDVTRERTFRAVSFIQENEGETMTTGILLIPGGREDMGEVLLVILGRPDVTLASGTQDLDLLMNERAAELSQLNGFLTAIVDSSTETSIIAVGPGGTILSFNEGACRMFLYMRTEVVGRMQASELFADGDSDTDSWEELHRLAREEGKCQRLLRMKRKDGTVFSALADVTPLLDADRRPIGTLLLARDMTETMRTQEALEEKQKQLQFLNTLSYSVGQTLEPEEICSIALHQLLDRFDGILGGVFLKEQGDGGIRLVVIEPDNRRGRLHQILQPTQDDFVLAEEGEILLHDLSHIAVIQSADGTPTPGTKLVLPLLSKASFVGLIVLLIRERLKRSEELLSFLSAVSSNIGGALENALLYIESLKKSQEIKKQNQELDDFAYVVSHDLKEPLAGISFISNLLFDEYYETLDETARAYINNLKEFSQRLGSLIDALLELSRIGRVNAPFEEVQIIDVIHNVCQSLSYRLATKETQLKLPEELPVVYGEKTRIEQVFFNLLSNAIKFNDKESVIVEIGWKPSDEGFIEFLVRDNGIGIEEQYFEKIFRIFERLHQREEYEGNGAGLTIVKKIVEHHGGRIWLESEPGVGTTFHFTLPKIH